MDNKPLSKSNTTSKAFLYAVKYNCCLAPPPRDFFTVKETPDKKKKRFETPRNILY